MERRSDEVQDHAPDPVERVDPFDQPDTTHVWAPGAEPDAAERARERLRHLQARISELDARMAGLMDRRASLTREVFELRED